LENNPLNNKQMEKQTAVEWLEERMPTVFKNLTINKHLFEQAKEMHKQEIENAWEDGHDSFSTRNAEQYYNETFGGKL
jgi:ribonuclease HI